jgi:BirA family biotin operon repressor/biotin-[acetyl-CoA-carboxylase] ligase
MDLRILRFDQLSSTNTEALSQARRGAAEGLCVVAKSQTEGRGRGGRRWISEPDAGLYLSIVLKPGFEIRYFPLTTLAAAVAVAETLASEFGISADIKWPNDLLVGERKICGILAETGESPTGTVIVLGIGLNLQRSSVSEEIADSATSVEAETGSGCDPDSVLNPLLRHFFFHYEKLIDTDGRAALRRRWAELSSFFSGRSVRVALHGRTIEGVTGGLDESGGLIVTSLDGTEHIVQAGDVTTLRT